MAVNIFIANICIAKQNVAPGHLLGENKELRMGKLYKLILDYIKTYFLLSGAQFHGSSYKKELDQLQ